MQAVTFIGKIPTVTELADPEPGSRQLLLRVSSAGLNGADLIQATGGYPPPPGAPDTPGLEVAGEVVGVGPGCLTTSVGDRVMAVVQGGGHAELCLVDEPLAMVVPPGLALDVAGGFPEVFATAFDALFTQGGLSMGERVCIHGAAGGVGTAAVQLAVAAGADVTATVRTEVSRAGVAALGAKAIDPAEFVEAGPFDVILELVGAPNWPANVEALASEGHITVIGVGAGSDVQLSLLGLMLKRATISASTLRARPLEQRATLARLLERHVLPGVVAGRIVVPVAATFALSEAADAYSRFAEGAKLGKILLRP